MTGAHIWSKEFGDAADQYANFVTTDKAHNVIVVGMFAGSTNFGGGIFTSAGGYDGFLAKFSPSGAYLWGKAFGGVGYERTEAVATDGDGNIIAAGFVESTADFGGGSFLSAGGRDAFVVKYDSAGKHVWSRVVGDASQQEAFRVTTSATGAVFLVGRYAGFIQFGNAELVSAFGTYDAYLAKMSP